MEEPDGWIIATGNVRDGFTFYGNSIGQPFLTHDEALEEAERRFKEYNIIPFFKTSE